MSAELARFEPINRRTITIPRDDYISGARRYSNMTKAPHPFTAITPTNITPLNATPSRISNKFTNSGIFTGNIAGAQKINNHVNKGR